MELTAFWHQGRVEQLQHFLNFCVSNGSAQRGFRYCVVVGPSVCCLFVCRVSVTFVRSTFPLHALLPLHRFLSHPLHALLLSASPDFHPLRSVFRFAHAPLACSVFNHCDIIGLQNCRTRWNKTQNKGRSRSLRSPMSVLIESPNATPISD